MSIFDSLKSSIKNSAQNALNQAVNNAKGSTAGSIRNAVNSAAQKAEDKIKTAMATKTYTYKFDKLPTDVTELKALKEADLKTPAAVAALTILALYEYSIDKNKGKEMLDFLNGPEDVSARDATFIDDRYRDDKAYVIKSYFDGAKPENNYTPSTPYKITVNENTHSRDQYSEGYITLWIPSGGADSDREIILRTKKSTGEWFVWNFANILSDIRIPVSKDAWA